MSVGKSAMPLVVVCTMGRTGSTLLSGILNSIEGYCIRGENWGFLLGLYEGFVALQKTAQFSGERTDATHSFYGGELVRLDLYIESVREILRDQLAPPPGTRVMGFKEIRWLPSGHPFVSLQNYFRFICRLSSTVKFILLTRETDAMVRSGWWADEPKELVVDHVCSFYELVRNAPIDLFEIDYNNITYASAELRNMFGFLGEDFDEARYAEIRDRRHGF